MLEVVDRPRQRFLQQAIRGILLSGSLVVTELSRWFHDDCSDSFYRLKRLLNHLVSPRADLQPVLKAYRQALRKDIAPDTSLIVDMTDLAKPRARRMEYLAHVRDGSTDALVPGYWCLEIFANLPRKRLIPLAMDVFSIDDPHVGSMNLQIARNFQQLKDDLDGRGIYIADRGFDGLEMYETWFSLKAHFVVRQRGDRMVITANDQRIILRNLVERRYQHQAHQGHYGSRVYLPVRLPPRQAQLYAVASYRPGGDEPLMLLTNLVVQTDLQARQILRYYQYRWACEESGCFLKTRVGLERFRIRRYVAIQRLAILAMLAMGFLTWLMLHAQQTVLSLRDYISHLRKDSRFAYYRVLDGIQTLDLNTFALWLNLSDSSP